MIFIWYSLQMQASYRLFLQAVADLWYYKKVIITLLIIHRPQFP